MLKLVYSSTNKKKKFVVFMDDMRSMSGITCRSFVTINDAIDFAWHHNDPWLGNIDPIFMDRLLELDHPLLRVMRHF